MASASLHFLEVPVSLIHVPLNVYPHFIHPVLSLLLHPPAEVFLNISITPLECSVVCPTELARAQFAPLINRLDGDQNGSISADDYSVIQVDAEGMAGSRVLDLTGPLASAGVSIFFISTYFSDYILVPVKCVSRVTKALELRGFAFEKHTQAFIVSEASPVSTPPAKPVAGFPFSIQDSKPTVDYSARLVCCGARSLRHVSEDSHKVLLGIVTILLAQPLPKFFSITLAPDQTPLSLLLPNSLIAEMFPLDSLYVGDVWIPILLDLRIFPIHASGIVCAVASRLNDGTKLPGIGMSYLSTVYAGSVMVCEDDIEAAVDALEAYSESDMHLSVLSLGSSNGTEAVEITSVEI